MTAHVPSIPSINSLYVAVVPGGLWPKKKKTAIQPANECSRKRHRNSHRDTGGINSKQSRENNTNKRASNNLFDVQLQTKMSTECKKKSALPDNMILIVLNILFLYCVV